MNLSLRITVICLLIPFANAPQSYADISIPEQVSHQTLYLDVYVNGRPKGLIAGFVRELDGRFRSKAGELAEIGIDSKIDAAMDDWIYLEELPGVAFIYNESEQRILFTLDPSRTTLEIYNLRGTLEDVRVAKPDVGLALNYSLSGQFGTKTSAWTPEFNGASAFFDARLFSAYGHLTQSGFVDFQNTDNDVEFRRLDTTFSRSNPDKLLTYSFGDIISGGLGWTRPIRMGGMQLRRNFATRPDLITHPLPSVEGTALVPSTVDIYLGQLRLSSIDVDTGRFLLNDIPIPDLSGNLRVVIRDLTGTLREQILPFGAGRSLLRKGLFDFSVDVGVARTGYGTDSDTYDNRPIAVGSLRYGINDQLTLEGHAEVGGELANLGAGINMGLAKLGSIQVAVAGSNYQGRTGALLSAAYENSGQNYSFRAETRRVFGDYADLADVTATGGFDFAGLERISSYERVQASTDLWGNGRSIGIGYAHTENRDKRHRHFANMSFGTSLGTQSRFTLSGQAEIGGESHASIYAGLAFTLGANKNGYTGVTYGQDGYSAVSSVSKPLQQKPESWGYSASVRAGDHATRGDVLLSRFGEWNQTTTILSGSEDDIGIYGSIEGGAALIGGDIYLSRRIDDSFAIVAAGSPNVSVYHENHEIGRTDKNGRLLVPGIRSFEPNKLSIEPGDLPVGSTISETSRLVSLPERSGVVVNFASAKDPGASAIIILRNSQGEFLPPGSTAILKSSGEETVVGYDGETFVTNLGSENVIEVNTGMETCRASFGFQATDMAQPRIGPIACL